MSINDILCDGEIDYELRFKFCVIAESTKLDQS